MALPLLLMAGAGILGGGQYLLKKMDERRADSLMNDFSSMVNNTAFGQRYGSEYMAMAESLAGQGGILNRNSGDIQSLMGNFIQNSMQFDMQQAQQQRAMQQQWRQSNQAVLGDMLARREQNDTSYSLVQEQARQMQAAFKGGMTSSQDLTGMVYNLARMMNPREALNEGDVNSIVSSSGLLTDLLNKASKAFDGKAGKALAEEIYRRGREVYGSQRASWEQGNANVDSAVSKYRQQGYLPTDLHQQTFGTVDPQFQMQAPQQVQQPQQASPKQYIDNMEIQALIDMGVDPIMASGAMRAGGR